MPDIPNKKDNIFTIIKKDFFSISSPIRAASLSVFLFIFGRALGGDTFFSLYINTIVGSVFIISIITALIPFVKMFLSVSVGKLEDHTNIREVMTIGKWMYVVVSILYFLAGIFHCIPLLIGAGVLNGIASAIVFTSYPTIIRKWSSKENESTSFGLYFSAANLSYIIGAPIAALLVQYIQMPYLFLFIGIFAIISLLADRKIPVPTREQLQKYLGKESVPHNLFRRMFSIFTIKKGFSVMQFYHKTMYQAMGYEMLYSILNYVGFIFIPIVALQNNLTLTQIAIVFAIMRLPYIIDFFSGEFADKFSKKRFILIVLLFLSFLFAMLGFKETFGSIIVLSFGIALGLALIRPVISGLISDYTDPRNEGSITGIQEFTAKLGEVIGSFGFGVLTLIFGGMSNSFVFVGICLFVVAGVGIVKRFHLLNKESL